MKKPRLFIKTDPDRLRVFRSLINRYKRFSRQISCYHEIRNLFPEPNVYIDYGDCPKIFVVLHSEKVVDPIKSIQQSHEIMERAGFTRAGDWGFSYGSFDCEYHRNKDSKRHATVVIYIYSNSECEFESVEVTEMKNKPVGLCAKALESINQN